MTWKPRTATDRIADGSFRRRNEAGRSIEGIENPTLHCDPCNRRVSADMLIDERSELVCDACTWRRFVTGEDTPEAFYERHGAPKEVRERMQQKRMRVWPGI